MNSPSSRKETDSKISRTQKISRNETYKESLLRRIASGDPSSAHATKPASAPKLLPSTSRSLDLSTPIATQEPRKTSLPNNQSKNLNQDINNKGSVTTDTSKTELKFSKIVSMAFLIGPDLESKYGTSSSTKDAPLPVVKKIKDKERKSDAATISEPAEKDRKSTENAPAQISSVTTKKRKRNVMTVSEIVNEPLTTTLLPDFTKFPLEYKFGNKTYKRKPFVRKHLEKQADLNASANNSDSVNCIETSIEAPRSKGKKRKSEATNNSAIAKKARTNAATPKSSKATLKSGSDTSNTAKKPDPKNPLTLTTPPRRKSNPVRKSQKIIKHPPPHPSVFLQSGVQDYDDDDDDDDDDHFMPGVKISPSIYPTSRSPGHGSDLVEDGEDDDDPFMRGVTISPMTSQHSQSP